MQYAYAIVPDAAGVDVVARGDLDVDGILSTYTIRCSSDCSCGPLEGTAPLE